MEGLDHKVVTEMSKANKRFMRRRSSVMAQWARRLSGIMEFLCQSLHAVACVVQTGAHAVLSLIWQYQLEPIFVQTM